MPNERCVWVCGLQATNPARQSCTNEEMRGEKDLKYKRPESFNVFIDLHNLVRNQSIRLLFHDRSKKDQSKTMLSPRGQKRLVEYFIISTDLNNRTSSNSTTATSRVCLAVVYSHQECADHSVLAQGWAKSERRHKEGNRVTNLSKTSPHHIFARLRPMSVGCFGWYIRHGKLTVCNRPAPVVSSGALGVENGNPRRRLPEVSPEIRIEI